MNVKKKSKKSNKYLIYKLLSFILVISTVFLGSTIIYLDMLPIKYLVILSVLLISFILFLIYKLNHKALVITKLFISFITILLIILEIFISINLIFSLDFINNIFDNNRSNEVYGVYITKGKYSKINDLDNKKIVIYNNDENVEAAIDSLKNKINFEIVKEDSVEDAIELVNDETVEAFLVNEGLIDLYIEDNQFNLARLSEIRVNLRNDDKFTNVNVNKDSFVIYLSGVDSSGKVVNSSRSDVNMLVVVNPDKEKILLVSTPRDYYVTLASKDSKDKLTHAGIYGVDESALTLGLLYDVDVNFYARVNFSSFVKLINALGGITVDVEKPDYRYNLEIDCGSGYVCEQNSSREFGSDELIRFRYGKQTLNGEEALAYARNRYQYAGGDNDRQVHQQQVLKGITEKLMSKSILTKYNSILNSLSSGIKTNIDKDSISKLVNKQLNNNISWDIESLVATGTDSYDYCYSTGKSKAYVMIPDEESVNSIKLKIKEVMD